MKPPAYLHYVKDWITDLSEHPVEIEGAWIAACSRAWLSDERGVLRKTLDQWASIWRVTPERALEILTYLDTENIGTIEWPEGAQGGGSQTENENTSKCDMSRVRDGRVTVMSRRMVREEKARQAARLRKERQRGREKSRQGSRPGHIGPAVAVAFADQNNSADDTPKKPPKPRAPSKAKAKETAGGIYDHYVQKIEPHQKTRARAVSNLVKLFKEFNPETLKACVDNYHHTTKDRDPVFRKDPANFFGRDRTFQDYLPGTWTTPPGASKDGNPGRDPWTCKTCGNRSDSVIIDGECPKCRERRR